MQEEKAKRREVTRSGKQELHSIWFVQSREKPQILRSMWIDGKEALVFSRDVPSEIAQKTGLAWCEAMKEAGLL